MKKVFLPLTKLNLIKENTLQLNENFEGCRFEVSEIRYNYRLYGYEDANVAQPFFGFITGEVVVKPCGSTHNDYRRLYQDEDLFMIGRIWSMEDGNTFAVYIPCGKWYQENGMPSQTSVRNIINQAFNKTELYVGHKYYVNAWENDKIIPIREEKQHHPEEQDEFTIGSEGDGSMGFSHVIQEGCSFPYEMNEIGSVEPELDDFDEDYYEEWLQDEGLPDTEENKIRFIKDECSFALNLTDSEIYHHMDTVYMDYDEMVDEFGQEMADDMFKACLQGKNTSFEPLMYTHDDEVDINDIKSIEADAKAKLKNGGYFKGVRGFCLTDGTIVYTDAEHNMITRVASINDKFEAVRKGWVRLLDKCVDVGTKPTYEQKMVIRSVILNSEDEFYLTLFSKGSESGCKYIYPNWREVIADIDRFYDEGIKPTGGHGGMYESKNLIKENITDIVYHFTTLDGLIGILNDDAFETRLMRYDMWAFSFTRQRTSKIGYAAIDNTASLHQYDMNKCVVRLTVNGRELGYNYKSVPYNHFYREYDKASTKAEMTIEPNNRNNFVESEDCVLSYERTIPNASRYIEKIDILFRPNFHDGGRMFEEYYNELEEVSDLGFYADVYFDEEEFNKLNGRGMSISRAMMEIEDMMYSGEYFDDEELYESKKHTNENKFSVWYRGYNSLCDNFGSRHGLWLTDSLDYAEMYSKPLHGENGKIVKVILDDAKLNPCSLYDIDEYLGEEFDPYEPEGYWEETNLFNDLLKDGYNCYSMYYDSDGAEGLYLFDKDAIVSVEEMENEELDENINYEVAPADIDTSSFELENTLEPNVWDKDGNLNSMVRLKLLDIADDFIDTLNIKWVKPTDIILTGSLCNFNWSEYSDFDLHVLMDFSEVDERTELVKSYFDAKKNEWNENHDTLEIHGYPVELYVQDVNDENISSGIYSLEKNKWLIEPKEDCLEDLSDVDDVKIKMIGASIMTYIDEIEDKFKTEHDSHKIEELKEEIDEVSSKVKDIRSKSLNDNGEMGVGNLVYKLLRRKGYLDKIYGLKNKIYDKINSIE